ncbi:MAG TPA: ATP-grasp domain-containing protein [Methylomirabilota bacterium]|nr:ATP-grasp domain-containing protein [Methylomirabilota bacterium]
MQKTLRILTVFDVGERLPADYDFTESFRSPDWQTEADVVKAIHALGHTQELLAVHDDTDAVQRKIAAFQPDLVFNLVEQFRNRSAFERNFASFLELQGVPFSGCGSTGMTLCKCKSISKKILGYHRIRVPEFAVLPPGRPLRKPRGMKYPLLIKPLREEASAGISLASFVENEEQFRQRVAFVHEKFNQEAIAEEYIEGRELYVSLLGNDRLQVLPVREMVFREVPPDEPKIATYKAKWDEDYRRRWGITNAFAGALDAAVLQRLENISRKIYRALGIDGYARLDLRLTPDNEIVFIEANPNPHLAQDEDFALSAREANMAFPDLIDRIIGLGMTAHRG